MQDKYNLTVENNILLAKRNIVDYIFKSANLEGIAVTYPDTKTILDGINNEKYTVDEITTINNLKNTWSFIFDNINEKTSYTFICEINKLIGVNLYYRPGVIRTTPVNIGGTSWVPELPIESKIKEDLEKIENITNKTEYAIEMMLYLVRAQLFIDGNKRTSMMVANKIMIENGCGIISVPIKLQSKFYEMLIEFYETNNKEKIKKFIYDNCVEGIELK